MNLASTLPLLLGTAVLLPLISFVLILFFGPRMGSHGKGASALATGAIGTSCLLSFIALISWLSVHGTGKGLHEVEHGAVAAVSTDHPAANPAADHAHDLAEQESVQKAEYTGELYTLGQFGSLKITISYYIDALTIAMFSMVTLIATLIHFYASGYMHDELHDITDHEVTLRDGHHLHRHGRYYRFFQFLSLFCFSMLGLVFSGNIVMVFVFWELVGICSYFLIGFYIERKSASNAANKAFIVNRVGDFGMIIGLMALWGSLGTFSFGNTVGAKGEAEPGLFSLVRTGANHHELQVPDAMVKDAAAAEIAAGQAPTEANLTTWRKEHLGYGLLVVAGLGIFCGCVGKSAQFPLHVWLPDAMEGPTPVSALVHSATMVAAGVYLVGRFYPVFAPEVLLTIAYIGAITLFLAATIAITALDIKRVLAYSTISQLGYMMLALGVGGWIAGLFHLITHAFFKSLLFMCSGSVIHATHTNDMSKMGGLRHKMPYTAYTMLVGCLAIMGAGIPFLIGFSGFHSKDSIIEQALSFTNLNPAHRILFLAAAGGAAITAFYMFRLWYLTFSGQPRDQHIYDHAHESPKVMVVPLMVLAVFAIGIGWTMPFTGLSVTNLLEQARPEGTMAGFSGGAWLTGLTYPNEHLSHNLNIPAGTVAFCTALAGFLLATAFYGWKLVSPSEARQQFKPIYNFLVNKWYFDELYQAIFVQPVLFISRRIAEFDRKVIDNIINGLAWLVRRVSVIDDWIDRTFVDGLVNLCARWTFSAGMSLRNVQTGKLRQYVMFIAIGTVALFILVSFFWSYSAAAH
ncbi:MAG TPA: NADH-quinone oxidoreductase subunit L [Pirellulales bacterium]|jgi:NADH-quinone oxidoreductase subunit L|nr:NADH-quinone oxidoreductase subunit L [Pirellulales bacterium]